jgi:hypothetical protein
MGRIDSALERWNPPRYSTLFFTFVVPAIIWLPEKLTDFVKWLGLSTETVSPGALVYWGQTAISYLVTVLVPTFMAKRGLFLGADPIWFPGWQDGDGAYQKEREIFGSVELRVREAPIDLWVYGILMLISYALLFLTLDETIAWWQSWWSRPPVRRCSDPPAHVAMTMQSLLSPAADMLPHWLWAAMCANSERSKEPLYSITSSARAERWSQCKLHRKANTTEFARSACRARSCLGGQCPGWIASLR